VGRIFLLVLYKILAALRANKVNLMTAPLPRMCVLAATPLSIHFFFKPHLLKLVKFFDVSVVCNFRNEKHVTTLDLPVREVPVGIERKISLWRDWIALFSLLNLFKRERFDIVVSVAPKAGLLAMLGAYLVRVPKRVHIFQGEVWASRRGPMRWLLKSMDTLTARLATHVIAVSVSELQYLEDEDVLPPSKAKVLGAGSICGVDLTRFHPDPLARANVRKALNIPQQATVCIFLGRLNVDKGVLDLARAFIRSAEKHADLWLLLAGPDEGQIGYKLSQLVPKEISRRILLTGYTHTPEKMLAACDFLCLPSHREGLGMVILEAAAVGLPSIGTRIYGITDAIADGHTGRLVPLGDINALSDAITHWCLNPQERSAFSRSARDRVVSEFDQRLIVAGYIEFFLGLFEAELPDC
jgi:glycosyltransferase involved in cell wall biosynthesis